jgi:hypothetical protein
MHGLSSHQPWEKQAFAFQESPGRRLRCSITVLHPLDSPQHIVVSTLRVSRKVRDGAYRSNLKHHHLRYQQLHLSVMSAYTPDQVPPSANAPQASTNLRLWEGELPGDACAQTGLYTGQTLLPYKLDTWTAWPSVPSAAEYSFLQIQTSGESTNRDVSDFSRPIPSGRATLTYWWHDGGFKRISAHLSVLDHNYNDTGLMLRLQLSDIDPSPTQTGVTQNIVIPYSMRSFGDDPNKNYYGAHSLYPSVNDRSCTKLWAMMLPEEGEDTYHKARTWGPAYQVWPLNWGQRGHEARSSRAKYRTTCWPTGHAEFPFDGQRHHPSGFRVRISIVHHVFCIFEAVRPVRR